eukprot:TRINITY_DN9653_c0_g1_i3.p1 TRINITY_DN9653_c0_g1~~TRINITY_DN9653_c0_g1_i3.p1  ORF type:complete len:299 (+),score=46.59 TRINITY_DN9653_c0_g1_i3:275-1171(+)
MYGFPAATVPSQLQSFLKREASLHGENLLVKESALRDVLSLAPHVVNPGRILKNFDLQDGHHFRVETRKDETRDVCSVYYTIDAIVCLLSAVGIDITMRDWNAFKQHMIDCVQDPGRTQYSLAGVLPSDSARLSGTVSSSSSPVAASHRSSASDGHDAEFEAAVQELPPRTKRRWLEIASQISGKSKVELVAMIADLECAVEKRDLMLEKKQKLLEEHRKQTKHDKQKTRREAQQIEKHGQENDTVDPNALFHISRTKTGRYLTVSSVVSLALRRALGRQYQLTKWKSKLAYPDDYYV